MEIGFRSIWASMQNATIAVQSCALTAFWGMVTLGRIFFALIEKNFKEYKNLSDFTLYCRMSFRSDSSVCLLRTNIWVFLHFGLSGFGCSALLPLTISFGSLQLKSIATSISGGDYRLLFTRIWYCRIWSRPASRYSRLKPKRNLYYWCGHCTYFRSCRIYN